VSVCRLGGISKVALKSNFATPTELLSFEHLRRIGACKTASGIVAGLSGLRFHDLRHHCITKLAEAGVAEQTLMAIAGHVSREMLEHYSHIRMQAKREAVESLENVVVQTEPLQQVRVN
jgi:integrase